MLLVIFNPFCYIILSSCFQTGGEVVIQSPDTATPEAPVPVPVPVEATKGEGGGDGSVVVEPLSVPKSAPVAGRIVANKWAVVTVSVQPSRGRLSTYVNGSLCSIAEDLDPADLRLQHRIVILGGGKQAHVRGGDIRRVTIHNSSLEGVEVKDLYYTLIDRNPGVGGLWAKVQARVRGFLSRKKNAVHLSPVRRDPDDEGDEENGDEDSSDKSSEYYSD